MTAPGYRPWLDGVRAVAVLLVVTQHVMGAQRFDLGFTGVGIFFGLSGYLITALLLDQRAAHGHVSLPAFYLRRAARLLPALLLVLVTCNALFLIVHDLAPLRGSIAALSYTANYAEVLNGKFVVGYGPTWSLAIEEHFYLLWPLALVTLTSRFGLRGALRATLLVCAFDLLWRALLAILFADYTLLSIGTLERADALLYGCAAAIAVRAGWRPKPWMLWAGIVAIGLAPFAFHTENFIAMVPGSAVIGAATAAVVVSLDYTTAHWLRRLLSGRTLVTVGILSYSIYLWHGPLMRLGADLGYRSVASHILAVGASFVVAAISYHYLEAPVRAWARHRTAPGLRAQSHAR